MESALYYTFSTIAQTLAGALGLLAAFVLVRLNALGQGLDNLVTQSCAALRVEEDEELLRMRHRGDWRQALDVLRETRERQLAQHANGVATGTPQGEERYLTAAIALLALRTNFLESIASIVKRSVAAIVYCFVGLAFTPALSQSWALACAALAVGVLGGGAAIVLYGVKLVRILREV